MNLLPPPELRQRWERVLACVRGSPARPVRVRGQRRGRHRQDGAGQLRLLLREAKPRVSPEEQLFNYSGEGSRASYIS